MQLYSEETACFICALGALSCPLSCRLALLLEPIKRLELIAHIYEEQRGLDYPSSRPPTV